MNKRNRVGHTADPVFVSQAASLRRAERGCNRLWADPRAGRAAACFSCPTWHASVRRYGTRTPKGFFGLDYAKGHLIRACREGVAYSLRRNLETAREAGAEARALNAMGGSANSWVWTQLKADVTKCRIDVPSSDTATTWGTAMMEQKESEKRRST